MLHLLKVSILLNIINLKQMYFLFCKYKYGYPCIKSFFKIICQVEKEYLLCNKSQLHFFDKGLRKALPNRKKLKFEVRLNINIDFFCAEIYNLLIFMFPFWTVHSSEHVKSTNSPSVAGRSSEPSRHIRIGRLSPLLHYKRHTALTDWLIHCSMRILRNFQKT